MAKHNEIGQWGEQVAVDLLVSRGYAIVERNAKVGHYELDIVAMKGDRMVFVEVKTRSSELDDPIDAIDRKKIRYLCRAADTFMRARQLPHEVQFDVVAVIGNPSGDYTVRHYPDAFLPPLGGAR